MRAETKAVHVDESVDPAVLASLKAMSDKAVDRQMADIVASSLGECEGRLAALRSAVAAGDSDQATRLAHALNGVSAMFGAARLPALCAELEDLVSEANLAGARAALPAVEAEFALFRAALRRVFAFT